MQNSLSELSVCCIDNEGQLSVTQCLNVGGKCERSGIYTSYLFAEELAIMFSNTIMHCIS